jgi:hypothetical protein
MANRLPPGPDGEDIEVALRPMLQRVRDALTRGER